MRYAFIDQHRKIWPIADQRRVLEVAASGFRAWRKRCARKVCGSARSEFAKS